MTIDREHMNFGQLEAIIKAKSAAEISEAEERSGDFILYVLME